MRIVLFAAQQSANRDFYSERLLKLAQDCGATPAGCFLTSPVVINNPAVKRRLGVAADAVDMETFHVLTQAREAGTPAVAIRAVSDDVETAIPIDFNRLIDKRGEIAWLPAGENKNLRYRELLVLERQQ